MKLKNILTTAVLGAFLTLSASAANIVVNGNFENGLTGWTNTAFGGSPFGTCPTSDCGVGGSDGAASIAVGGEATISQVLSTVIGAQYQISVWESQSLGILVDSIQCDCGPFADFDIFWNGVSVGGDHSGTDHAFQQFTALVTGTGSDTLMIGLRNDPNISVVDDIVVDEVTSTPEPATGALFGLALLGVAPLAKKLRRKA